MGTAARARLIGDGGEAAASPAEFFRSPPFLEAEHATHSLVVEGDGWTEALPLLVREIPGEDRIDAISPYGYPGAAGPPADPPESGQVDWSETGLVSIFVRERIGGSPCFAGGTVRNRVQICDPALDTGIRKRLLEQIRRNERRGWAVARVPSAEAGEPERAAFERAYGETMARAGAQERYLYDHDYFATVLRFERSWLLLAARGGVAPSAGAIAAASDGYLHYYLGGTTDEALTDSPMKNLFAAMIELSGELGLPLSLGGGIAPGDSLEGFKRGFANREAEFRSHEIVADPDAFRRLSSAPADHGGFFPPYRA